MSTYADRLAALRAQLKRDSLDGFVVPLTDEHMSEYVGAYAQRLAWLTGFRGSAGTAAVLPEEAAIFTDGRYTIQVREQVSPDEWSYQAVPETNVAAWLEARAPEGARIGYDPWLHTRDWARQATEALAVKGAELVPVVRNPIDAIWDDRPAPSEAVLTVQPDDLAGQSAPAKRQELAEWLAAEGADATVISALDSIAWTFNLRGADVSHTPVGLAFAIAHADGTADLFVAPEKMTDAVRQHLGNGVRLHDRDAFAPYLAGLKDKTVAVDPERAVVAIFDALEAAGATLLARRDPTVLAKAIKNPVEIQGHRDAQTRDGAAIVRFLRWLEAEAPKGELTELSAAAKLQAMRAETGLLRDLSFDTISGAGPNAALPHYKVTEDSNRPIRLDEIYLVDSGGQYVDGTTDITRTVIVGTPSEEMKDRFTRVLKGHIALAMARFPDGTRGSQLDTLARQFLWDAGLDYAHGTGHGIGAYLSVHEGPQRISPVGSSQPGGDEPLRAGMMLSNEPGYYKTGDYGIRIENLVLVVPIEVAGAEKDLLGFETLTFAPIDRNLIEPAMLSDAERHWLNAYHADVLERLGPELDPQHREWLLAACAPL